MTRYILLIALLFSAGAGAATRYVCNSIATCNANGGSGWSGTPGTLSGCGSKTNPCNTLTLGMQSMSSGDTLIVGNGTYTGASNKVTYANHPAAGPGTGTGDARFSIVKAEVPGYVILGDGTAHVFDSPTGYGLNGNSYGNGALRKWIKWEGLIIYGDSAGVVINNGDSPDFTTSDLAAKNDLHWYFKGCGFRDSDGGELGTINLSYLKNIIFEDSFSLGRARYGQNAYITDGVVFRRHLDRRDATQAGSSCPTASYMNYASHGISYQNVLSLDVDSAYYDGTVGNYGNWYVRNSYNSRNSTNTAYLGSIALNMKTNTGGECFGGNIGGIYIQSDPTGTTLTNNIFWRTGSGIYSTGPSVTASHITIGPRYTDGPAVAVGSTSNVNISNSNCYTATSTLGTMSGSSAYNNDYNCTGSFSGSNITTTNTAYQYTVKPETSFPDGNDGQKKGAKVLYAYGTDGAFYGETDYAVAPAETAGNKLWPWGRKYSGDNSWEKRVWELMRQNYGTTDETRGFAQSSQSITNWVATGAGTLTPTNALSVDGSGGTSVASVDANLYDEAGGDTTAPSVTILTSDPSVISADSLIVSGIASDVVGVSGCKWQIGSAPNAGNGTVCTGTTSFSCATSGYSIGSNALHVGCYDAAGNYGPDSITVSFPCKKLAIPTGLAFVGLTANPPSNATLSFDWSDVTTHADGSALSGDLSNYWLHWGAISGGPYNTASSASSQISVGPTQANITYYAIVSAESSINQICDSYQSSEISLFADAVPPALSGLSPTGTYPKTTTSVSLGLTTNESATCRHGSAGTAWASKTAFSTTGSTSHSATLAVWAGLVKRICYQCRDALLNESAESCTTFSVSAKPKAGVFN